MNINQAAWAEQHDWCVSTFEDIDRADGDSWVVLAEERGIDNLDLHYAERIEFTDYKALRAWAGY